MTQSVKFETPENIEASYQSAGSGTRFTAWFVDNLLLMVFSFFLIIALLIAGAASDFVIEEWFEPIANPDDEQSRGQAQLVFIGVGVLVWGLGSFFYFGLSELFLQGQTIGKRLSKIRVVKADGFSLDPVSILVRNLFRPVDQLPPLWIVPVLSAKSQRFGDMVAGTMVIADETQQLSAVREALGNQTAVDARFRFDATTLKRARPEDFTTIERILERWNDLDASQRDALAEQVVSALATRLETEMPKTEEYSRYLEDLLAAEYRRQNRHLG